MKRIIIVDFTAFKGFLLTLPEMWEQAEEVTREQAAPYIKDYLKDKQTETVITTINGVACVCDHNVSVITRYFGDDGDSKVWTKQEVKRWLSSVGGPALCNKEDTLLFMLDFRPVFEAVTKKTISRMFDITSIFEGVLTND